MNSKTNNFERIALEIKDETDLLNFAFRGYHLMCTITDHVHEMGEKAESIDIIKLSKLLADAKGLIILQLLTDKFVNRTTPFQAAIKLGVELDTFINMTSEAGFVRVMTPDEASSLINQMKGVEG